MRFSWVRFAFLLAGFAVLGNVVACNKGEQRAPWRDDAERACLRSGAVVPSDKIVLVPAIGSGACGMNAPFKVSELPNSRVTISKPATMTCRMIPALDEWVTNVVQPAAVQQYGSYVTEIETAGAYSCRRISGSAKMSEHSFGNAMDIRGFKLADGRRIKVGHDDVKPAASYATPFATSAAPYAPVQIAADEEWEQMAIEALENIPDDDASEQNFAGEQIVSAAPFLDAVRQGGCNTFSTVLGPGQRNHDDHLHFDLARHYNSKRVCK